MQIRAIVEAACNQVLLGNKTKPKILVPMVAHQNELETIQTLLAKTANEISEQRELISNTNSVP